MLKQHASLYRRMMIVADVIIAGFSFLVAYAVRSHYVHMYPLSAYFWVLPVNMALWGILLYFSGMYMSFRLKSLSDILYLILRSGFFGFMVFTSLGFLFETAYVSRYFILVIFALTSGALMIEKIIMICLFREVRKKGFNFRNILIVGTGKRARRFIDEVNQNREVGLKIIGLVDVETHHAHEKIHGHSVIGTVADIPQIIEKESVDIVVFIVPYNHLHHIEQPILYCETIGIQASVAMDFFDLDFATATESQLFGFPLLSFSRTNHRVGHLLFKTIIDTVLSFLAMVILSPLVVIVALLIKATSPGPVFFKQQRCGLNGRLFTLYKFRTMGIDAEAQLEALRQHNQMEGPAFKMDNDPRITSIGGFLRKSSLDELPQLWNVLKGDMALVGPRPPLPDEVKQYDQWQRRRLSMRPGITCFWQIKGRNNIKDFNQWAKLDLDYIDHWSLWTDIIILLRTIPAVFLTRGAK